MRRPLKSSTPDRKIGRPRKCEESVVREIADMLRYYDGLPFHKLRAGDVWQIELGGHKVTLTNKREIPDGVGQVLCELKPELRSYVFRQLARELDGIERKSGRYRADHEIVRRAWRLAKSKYFPSDVLPTFGEVADQYLKITDLPLDRRTLKRAGCLTRAARRGNPHEKKKRRQRST